MAVWYAQVGLRGVMEGRVGGYPAEGVRVQREKPCEASVEVRGFGRAMWIAAVGQ